MDYFYTRYEALKAYPNAIIRKVLKGIHQGDYVAFNDHITYNDWKNTGDVK